jgi:eukaryotic-like serine/threonine-protein kinase
VRRYAGTGATLAPPKKSSSPDCIATITTSTHPGERIGSYYIERLVTRSGTASIFQGTDLRTGRPVAIKILHPEIVRNARSLERFHREAKIGRKFNHPGVIKVLPQEEPAQLYIVSEWIGGRSLRQVLDEEGKLEPERAVSIARGVCDVLAYIHGKEVVHCDLKPENIIVAETGHVTLIDFGIAALGAGGLLTFANPTPTMGTADYVSPEQVKGRRVDARSDVYALGVVLYEMLTGTVPFHCVSPLAAMNQRLVSDPIPPSDLAPEISPRLQEIVLRALKRDRKARCGSANEFARALECSGLFGTEASPARASTVPTMEGLPLPNRMGLFAFFLASMIPIAIIFELLVLVARL